MTDGKAKRVKGIEPSPKAWEADAKLLFSERKT